MNDREPVASGGHEGDPEYDYAELGREGSPLPDADSFRGETTDPAQAAELRRREIEFAQFMVERASDSARAAEARRQAVDLADEDFNRAMSKCDVVQDSVSELNYGVFSLNQDKEGRPLVVFLAIAAEAQSGVGRDVVYEFASHVDRPIVVIDNEGMGKTDAPGRSWLKNVSLKSMGESRLRVLDELAKKRGEENFGDFDVAGYSLGGGVALATAAAAGERVREVVTVVTGGFEDDSLLQQGGRLRRILRDEKVYKKGLGQEAADRAGEVKEQGEKSTKSTLREKIRSLRGHAKAMLTGAQSDQAVAKLAAATAWTTIVGSEDPATDWRKHLEAARGRNEEARERNIERHREDPQHTEDLERTSEVHVIAGGTHSVKDERAAMAEMVAKALDRNDA